MNGCDVVQVNSTLGVLMVHVAMKLGFEASRRLFQDLLREEVST